MTIQHTPRLGLPYPQRGDTSDVPRDIGALATALETLMNQLIPIGALHMWTAVAAPSGWLVCDGSVLLRAGTYAALFGVIGTNYNYGTVDSTHFCLPNFTARMPFGMEGTTFPLGYTGGQTDVVLNPDMIPPHTHPVEAAGTGMWIDPAATNISASVGDNNISASEQFAETTYNPVGSINVNSGSAGRVPSIDPSANWGGSHGLHGHALNWSDPNHNHALHDPTHAHTIDVNTPSGYAHDNMPPYQVVNYIIRYQ